MKRNTIAFRIVSFLREHGGIREIHQAKFAEMEKCSHGFVYTTIRKLKNSCVISKIDNSNHTYFLNEIFINVARIVINYLSKYPDGAAIDNSVFSVLHNIKQPMLVLVLKNLCDLGVLTIVSDGAKYRFNSTNYKVLIHDENVWRNLFEPKASFNDFKSHTVGEKLIAFLKTNDGRVEIVTVKLAETLGCSRWSILSAIKKLTEEGKIIVEQRTKKGRGLKKGIYVLPGFEQAVDKPDLSTPENLLTLELNKALHSAVQAQELAIKFGEEMQKAKTELAKVKAHNEALLSANEELRQKLHAKDLEIKFVERTNDELASRSQNNQQRLAELQRNISV